MVCIRAGLSALQRNSPSRCSQRREVCRAPAISGLMSCRCGADMEPEDDKENKDECIVSRFDHVIHNKVTERRGRKECHQPHETLKSGRTTQGVLNNERILSDGRLTDEEVAAGFIMTR